MTAAAHLQDFEQKIRCWGDLSHYPDADRDAVWLLLGQLPERDARIAELGARQRRDEWLFSRP